MTRAAIRTEALGKMYRIRVRKEPPRTTWHAIGRALASPFDWLANQLRQASNDEILWALRDVDLEVPEGDIVGIVGMNGAGKSTFLKLLSRITCPTEGHAAIWGRVGSLIEVGTGFHGELSGRENIYMNGSILGMKKREIDHRLDEIVDFSGVDHFIDTPIKRYSSGMKVRLGFAVAAHMNCDILLVDEVLSVGDVAFQTRCMERIRELTASGVTTLIVSHNMASIQRLCRRVVWFNEGRIRHDGPTEDTMAKYIDHANRIAMGTVGEYVKSAARRGSGEVRFTQVQTLNENGIETSGYRMGEAIRIHASYKAFKGTPSPQVFFGVRDVSSGAIVTSVRREDIMPDLLAGQRGQVECVFEPFGLRPGRYALALGLCDKTAQRAAYDIWDGSGAGIVISAEDASLHGDFILGYDRALVSVPHTVKHRPLQEQ